MAGKQHTKKKRPKRTTADQLDRMLFVTSAKGWLALLAIFVVMAVVVVWSVLGEVATYVEARGILLNRGGKVVNAVAAVRGRLSDVAVAAGDEVEMDAVVAEISNEETAERYASALALREEHQQALEAAQAAVAKETQIFRANNARHRKHLDELEAAAIEMLDVARHHLENSRQLYEQRVISRVSVERSQEEFNQAHRTLLDLSRDRDVLEANEIRQENDNAARIREMKGQLQAAERQVREIETLVSAERVLAPASGRVIEIKAATGAIVESGQAVVSIRTGAAELEVLLYVPPAEGKQVEVGMQALISPATVRREEFGALRGEVESISSFPISFEGMVAVLQNQSLARTFSEDGPPYAGRITLLPDLTTVSGFAWTSPKASEQRLTPGTLASIEIKSRSQPPITLAVPLLKELLGIR